MRLLYLLSAVAILFVTAACSNTPPPAPATIVSLPQGTRAPVVVLTTTPAASACKIAPAAPFAPVVARAPGLQQKLSCPVADGQPVPATEQYFERGYTLWRKDLRRIYVLQMNGSWQTFADTWVEGQPPDDPNLKAPQNLYQPVHGFGKVWRENPDVKDGLGWALRPEEGLMTVIQQFQGGTLIYGGGDRIRALYSDGTWQEFPAVKAAPQGPGVPPAAYPAVPAGETPGAYPQAPQPEAPPTGYP